MKRLLAALACVVLLSCERTPPPEPSLPPPLPTVVAPAPPPPPARTSFEGTWLTDRGAFIIHEGEGAWGCFLPVGAPGTRFAGRFEAGLLFITGTMDGASRWKGHVKLTQDGHGIAGTLNFLPCRGRRVGPSREHGVPSLLEALRHDDPWIRREAAHALGALGPPAVESIPELIQALEDPDDDARRAILRALARLGAPPRSALPALRCLLRHEDAEVRTAAADALGSMGPQAIEARSDLAAEAPRKNPAAIEALLAVTEGRPDLLEETLVEDAPGLAPAIRKRVAAAPAIPADPGHDWPQWRGPDKDNVSKETGLLERWPREGPPLAWEVWGFGDGNAAPTVRDGRVYLVGHLQGWEFLTALDATTGLRLWSARLGPGVLTTSHMRWVSQRSPSVGPELVYAYLNSGTLVALRARDGREAWRLNYADFGEREKAYGFADHPIVEGDRLILTPAASKATIAAVDARSGRVLWTALAPAAPQAACPSTVAARGQFIVAADTLHGFAASDGKHLWSLPNRFGYMGGANVETPSLLNSGDLLVRGPSRKISVLRFTEAAPVVTFQRKESWGWFQDSYLALGTRFFNPREGGIEAHDLGTAPDWRLELPRTDETWEHVLISADGRLYALSNAGTLHLIDVLEKEMKLRSSFDIPSFVRTSSASNPVIARGRLYVRDDDRLLCFDLRRSPPPFAARARFSLAPPDLHPANAQAAFVPTPHDIVVRMLDLAGTRATDVVVDLGSGDGRILIAAAERFGAKAVGWEIDPDLIELSRRETKRFGTSVRIEEADLFTADLSGASVVALYLPEELLTRLKPALAKLKPGARVVSHQFKIPGVKPERTLLLRSREDADVHALHLWTAPLKLD